jgi:hypothetical protein
MHHLYISLSLLYLVICHTYLISPFEYNTFPRRAHLRDRHRRHCHHRPRRLTTSTLTSMLHPPAATALRDGHRCCHPCPPPRRWLMPTSHSSTTTTACDRLRFCLPPRRRSTSRVNVDVASYHCHCHVQSSLFSSSPSLSPPPFNVAHPRCILLPPPPCIIIVVFIIPVPVPVPAACQHRASTTHPPIVTPLRNRHCRPRRPPCQCRAQ